MMERIVPTQVLTFVPSRRFAACWVTGQSRPATALRARLGQVGLHQLTPPLPPGYDRFRPKSAFPPLAFQRLTPLEP
jgi:hypothetical protein